MNSYRILLVEDDPGDQVLIAEALGHDTECIHVELVSSLAEFDAAVHSGRYDCALFDFNLFEGFQAPALIPRLQEIQPDCPAVVVSGSDEQRVVIAALRCGIVDFVHKDDAIDRAKLWGRIGVAIQAARETAAIRLTERRKTERAIRDAETDALTGLANRRVMHRVVENLREMPVDGASPITLAMFDIDHFKNVNDQYGHQFGDLALLHVARRIREALPPDGIAIRWGGEEFVAILPNVNESQAESWALALQSRVRDEPVSKKNERVCVTISIGLCTQATSEFGVASVDLADSALYAAKRNGRDCIWRHSSDGVLVGLGVSKCRVADRGCPATVAR